MKTLPFLAVLLALSTTVYALDSEARITPAIQAQIDVQKRVVAKLASNSTLVSAVREQNKKGPIPGLTNKSWNKLDAGDPLVRSFQTSAAGKVLAAKIAGSQGMYRELFLSAAQGEKVAFTGKTSDYLHAGNEKFDLPMTGAVWQGKPEFDKSSHSYVIQLAAPVRSNGKPIGVLVAGLSMKTLEGR